MEGLTVPDEAILEDLSAEWESACDYSDDYHGICKTGLPAKWILFASCPECNAHVQRLLCTPCKDLVMSTEHGCICSYCDVILAPFRVVVDRIEPL